jgi:RNA polymerase sigma-70 factor (ECF subfamily)
VHEFARKRGLQEADTADLTQEVLRQVASSVGRLEYDPQRGHFRSWLFKVAQNKLHDFAASRRRHGQGTGDSSVQQLLENQPARPEDEAAWWDEEYRRRLFAWAAEQVRGGFTESTWQAFWRTAVDGQNPRDVAKALGLSVGAIYIAKSRVQARLKEHIEQLSGER